MSKSWATPGTHDDETVLDDLLHHVAPTIDDVAATLLRDGRPRILIGALVERAFDGKVSVTVSHRAELAQRVLNDRRFFEPLRTRILDALKNALAEELPVVLLVERGEGLVAAGIRRK